MSTAFGPQERACIWCSSLAIFASILATGCTVDFSGPRSDCGDGVIEASENCDDSNTASGDGCSSSCQVEDGWTCSGEPSTCETLCGDGVARGNEVCDGDDLRSLTCAQIGLGGGELICGDGCVFDASGCDFQAVCGNSVMEYPEECDGADLNDQTCEDLGYDAGNLFCTSDCAINSSDCVMVVECGDGVAEDPEDCDDQDLAGETCGSLGLGTGTLGCTGECVYDVGDCSGSATCGNDTVEFPEVCDGEKLAGETCLDHGYYGGTLGCLNDCTDFDLSGCSGLCGDTVVNGSELCDGADLGSQDCQDYGYYGGTLACEADCLSVSTSGCIGECGDAVVNGLEECDGADLDGEDCVSAGHFGGELACNASCSYDESACHLAPRIVINELSHGWPDTVELLNLSAVTVNLQGWAVDAYGFVPYGGGDLQTLNLPFYQLDPGQRVVLLDETDGTGGPPWVNTSAGTIQFYYDIEWHGGLSPGSAILFNDVGTPKDFVRWGGTYYGPPSGAVWADTPHLLIGQSGVDTSLSRVPDGGDTDVAGDFCVTLSTDGEPNGPCLSATTGTTVLITEVDISHPDRVELYNAGPLDVDLQGWTVYYYDDDGSEMGGVSLPSFLLEVGEYVELLDSTTDAPPYVSTGRIHISPVSWTPPDAGGCGLVDPAGNGRDFVRWGQSAAVPWAGDSFTDQPSQAPTPGTIYSLGRSSLIDTNTAGDWCRQFPTLGYSNGSCQ